MNEKPNSLLTITCLIRNVYLRLWTVDEFNDEKMTSNVGYSTIGKV